jgi:glutathione S-transferase
MSEFTVYGIPGSPFGRAVLIALEEKAAPYHLIAVPLQALRSAEHLARHPFGRVPVLEHGEFRLFETQAILRYLDRVLPEPSLTPADPRHAARMDQVMNINDWYLFPGVSTVISFPRVVAPRLLGRTTADEAAIAAALPQARQVLETLARELGEQAFFAGERPSLADCLLAPQLDFLSQAPEWQPLAAGHSNLAHWLERMSLRPSMQRTTWDAAARMARSA